MVISALTAEMAKHVSAARIATTYSTESATFAARAGKDAPIVRLEDVLTARRATTSIKESVRSARISKGARKACAPSGAVSSVSTECTCLAKSARAVRLR